ncbi:MAG: phosphomannomutase/phosphoglucomutase [Candidatus Aenigmarchaeota archaeon]|nr:phosphomannomutase/phosphoglucomutase [Candidatus Aenigmarchaeota archaeon]
MQNLFRSYDIRGVVGKNLNEKIAEKIGLAFGTYLHGEEDVIVGRDMRQSGEALKKSFIKGLAKTGCNAIDIGMVPTPLTYFSIVFLNKNAGVSITASHNPPEWNGFKLRGKNAIALLYEDELKKIERIFLSKNFIKSKTLGFTVQKDMKKVYVNKMCSKISLEKKLKVVLDVGNGMGGIAETIYRSLGYDVITLFKEPDGNFPNHLPNPAKFKTLKTLQKMVLKYKADIGISLDADCDRVGFVDNKGRIVSPDKTFQLFLSHQIKNKKGYVICDIRTPNFVIDYIKSIGGKPIISRAGSGYIMRELIEREAVFAGEMSGHFWFGEEWFNIDDGIFAGAKMLQILSQENRSFAKIVDEMPTNYFLPSKRIPCPERKKEKVIKEIEKMFVSKYDIIKIDGVKILAEDFSVLVRPSRTEPEIEIVVESKKNNVNKIAKKFEKIILNLI